MTDINAKHLDGAGLSHAFGKIKDAIDNIEVGGRNLLLYSQRLSKDGTTAYGYISSANSYGLDGAYQGCSVWSATKTQTSSYAEILSTDSSKVAAWTVGPDEWYVLSFWAKASTELNVQSFLFRSGNNTCDSVETSTGYKGAGTDGNATTRVDTAWKRYWVRWHFNSSTDPTLRKSLIIARAPSDVTGTIWIAGPKLEKGNKATDWTPAPEDVDTGISTAQMSADNAQSTALQAQSDIDNLEIGGRNLARGTAFANSTDLSYWYKNQNPILSVEDGSLKIVGNQTSSTPGVYTLVSVDEGFCTVSFWYKAITSGGAILSGIGLWNDTTIVINHNCNITVADTEWHYYSHTFEPTSSQASSINRLYIFLHQANHAVTDGLYINRLKLEKGNRATDWTPAPEDFDSRITAAESKLSGIAAGAEVNQNAFSNVKVGSTTVAADTKTDTLELAGSNVTLTPDATNDKVTIGITASNVTTALGNTAVARATGDASGNAIASTYVKKSGDTMTGSLTLGSNTQNSVANVGIQVNDVRNATLTNDMLDRAANFYFSASGTPDTQWWSLLHVKGWTGGYAAWELAGTAHNTDDRNKPLYVRTGNASNAFGAWREIFDSGHTIPIANGGTGATTVAGAIESLGAATAKDVKEVYSRGEQLIVNGNGFMGDNTNFSSFTFDGSKANGSPGSFTKSVSSVTTTVDELFPVDPSKRYKAEFDVMTEDPGAQMYAMLTFYDVDKRGINVQMVSYYDGSTTTLAQDLKNGDTKVYLTSAAGFQNTSAGHQRSLIFWNYTNSFGYTYPPETYSRNFYESLWASDSSVDKTNNTITLSVAWNKGTIPAGTPVSQNQSGGTYSYFWSQNNKAAFPREWSHVSGEYSGVRTSGTPNQTGKFWPGTAYCKIGWLWNYQASSTNQQGRIWITNVSVKMADADNVTGVVQPAHGGTGQTSLTNSANALINSLSTGTGTPSDNDYYVSQYAGGGTTTSTYHRRPVSALWTYIKGKISSWMKNLTAKGHLNWTSSTNDTMPVTSNTLAYWNGRYNASSSNLEYCVKGAFGTAAVADLSTSTSSTSITTAATSSAVKTAYDLANTANGTANTALSGVNGTLIYDHTYTIANGVATFTAHVYCKGVEVTSNYQDSAFSWSYRLSDAISETGTPSVVSLGTGKTKTINITTLGLGGHVIGTFTTD